MFKPQSKTISNYHQRARNSPNTKPANRLANRLFIFTHIERADFSVVVKADGGTAPGHCLIIIGYEGVRVS